MVLEVCKILSFYDKGNLTSTPVKRQAASSMDQSVPPLQSPSPTAEDFHTPLQTPNPVPQPKPDPPKNKKNKKKKKKHGASAGDELGGIAEDGEEPFGEQMREIEELTGQHQQPKPPKPPVKGLEYYAKRDEEMAKRTKSSPNNITHGKDNPVNQD